MKKICLVYEIITGYLKNHWTKYRHISIHFDPLPMLIPNTFIKINNSATFWIFPKKIGVAWHSTVSVRELIMSKARLICHSFHSLHVTIYKIHFFIDIHSWPIYSNKLLTPILPFPSFWSKNDPSKNWSVSVENRMPQGVETVSWTSEKWSLLLKM